MGRAPLGQTPLYARALNAAGSPLERAGCLRRLALEPAALLRSACERARLEDFGEGEFTQALAHLARATEEQSRLTLTGRIAVRRYLIDLLVNRLLMQSERSADPAIGAQRIERPVFILGLPRTGTTLLHNLIAQDPGVRVPLTWEVMFPAARGPGAGARVGRTERALRWLDRLAPDFKRIHPFSATLPQECIAITTHAFASIQFHTTQRVPDYQNWLEGTRPVEAYCCHRRFLQHLQAGEPARRWVLKAPGHLYSLDALLAVYPDACIVQTHRDPLRVVASIASHGVVLRSAFSDAVDAREVAADWSRRWCAALSFALSVRDADRDTGARFVDLHYEDIVRDPLAAVRAVYAHAGLELGTGAETAMRAFLAANPQDRHGTHRYTLEEFGLDRATESARYAAYCARFAVHREGEGGLGGR